MKSRIIPPNTFQPVTLEITFETAEEIAVFRTMYTKNLTIPQATLAGDPVQRTFRHILGNIYETLEDLKGNTP